MKIASLNFQVPKKDNWEEIANDFWTRWQFPNCIGVADGKHVQIQAPWKSGSKYYNYKVVTVGEIDSLL